MSNYALHALASASTAIDELIDVQTSQDEIQKLKVAKTLVLQALALITIGVKLQ